jgi:Na+/proline symporter
MHLHLIDWIIAAACLLICFVPALFFGKRAGKSTSEFFVSGRAVPWWLAGLSMVATTFSSDTPNLVTDIVRRNGVAGNWVWWAFVLTGVSTVFFYARLWRRSGVMTDLEFYEIRYSGKAAGVVRGFRAIYLGLLFNCMIMATVNLAACKIAAILFGLERWQTLLFVGVLNAAFAAHSGLWGVLVIDMIQFFIKMTAVVAAAYFALLAPQVGGLHGLMEKLATMKGPGGLDYLSILPDFRSNWDMAVAVFVMPVAVQWWAVWYPGAEPGGGSYIAQRMLASKSEKDALGAVLFFNIAHYVLRPWPWILVGLCSLLVYPELSDIQKAFPNLDPNLLGHDIAYPAMLKFLPTGFVGLMLGGLIAANSSTILTHLNWGASYLVHDFYRRFVRRDGDERHYVLVARLTTVGLFVCSSGLVYLLDTAKGDGEREVLEPGEVRSRNLVRILDPVAVERGVAAVAEPHGVVPPLGATDQHLLVIAAQANDVIRRGGLCRGLGRRRDLLFVRDDEILQIILLGKVIFYDKELSVRRNETCAFCHMPETGFSGPVSALNQTTVAYPGSVRTRFSARRPQCASSTLARNSILRMPVKIGLPM